MVNNLRYLLEHFCLDGQKIDISSQLDEENANNIERINTQTVPSINARIDDIKNTDIPMLFIIGSADINGTHETDLLYRNCSSSYKDMLVVNGATHGESYYRDEKEYIKRIEQLLEVKHE